MEESILNTDIVNIILDVINQISSNLFSSTRIFANNI